MEGGCAFDDLSHKVFNDGLECPSQTKRLMVSAWMVIKSADSGKVGTAKTGTFFLPGKYP